MSRDGAGTSPLSRRTPLDGRRLVTTDIGSRRATVLWLLLALFALRVTGQLLVVAGVAPFLPPMDDWQSGLLPYPLLLASQIAILGLLATVCAQFSRGSGYFVRYHGWLATPLWTAGWIYAGGMVIRYALLRRDSIPVVFHIVLATFLLVVAHHHRRLRLKPTNVRLKPDTTYGGRPG